MNLGTIRPGRSALACLALLLCAASAGAVTKMEMHAQMIAIAQQMSAIKGNPALAGEYAQLRSQYRALSQALGGDDPGHAIGAGAAVNGQGPEGLGPPLPPGCTGATGTTPSTNVPVAIVDLGTVSSTLTVSGMGTFLTGITASTSITHTFGSDLQFTLQSPGGVVVTLSTNNGGGNDNVFNGTTWTADANPGGPVPYASNDGLVTLHNYVDLVTATPLAPEESLGAFFGVDPNGIWTLTVADDAAQDVGSIDAWSVTITAADTPPTVTNLVVNSTDTPVAILDVATVTSTLAVAGAEPYLCNMTATTAITHTFSGDLQFTLTSPAGTISSMSSNNAGSGADVFDGTNWTDQANPGGQVPYASNDGVSTDHLYVTNVTATPLVGEEGWAGFAGEDANGNWVLTVADTAALDVGSIDSWSVDLSFCSCAAAPSVLEIPTLNRWGVGALALLLAGGAFFLFRRRAAA